MKQAIIAALVCLNAALLVALAFGPGTPPAHAQAVGGRTDYAPVTGQISRSNDAVFLIDTATRQLAVIRFDEQNERMRLVAKRSLATDFQRQAR